jgi:hypothetical protein
MNQPSYHHTYKRVIETMRSEGIRAEYAYFIVSKELGASPSAIKQRITTYCDMTGAIRPATLSEDAALISQLRKCSVARVGEMNAERAKSEQAATRLDRAVRKQINFLQARDKFVNDFINSGR